MNNTYEDISMGVTRLRSNGTFVRGSLHKTYNVMAIDFSGEKYNNIMGHTSEHLQQVIMQVKGQNESAVTGKALFNTSFSAGTDMN